MARFIFPYILFSIIALFSSCSKDLEFDKTDSQTQPYYAKFLDNTHAYWNYQNIYSHENEIILQGRAYLKEQYTPIESRWQTNLNHILHDSFIFQNAPENIYGDFKSVFHNGIQYLMNQNNPTLLINNNSLALSQEVHFNSPTTAYNYSLPFINRKNEILIGSFVSLSFGLDRGEFIQWFRSDLQPKRTTFIRQGAAGGDIYNLMVFGNSGEKIWLLGTMYSTTGSERTDNQHVFAGIYNDEMRSFEKIIKPKSTFNSFNIKINNHIALTNENAIIYTEEYNSNLNEVNRNQWTLNNLSEFEVVKIDSNLNVVWRTTIAFDETETDPVNIKQLKDGGYLIAGNLNYDKGILQKNFVVKLNANGEIVLHKKISELKDNYVWDFTELDDGRIALLTNMISLSNYYKKMIVMLNANGELAD
ncbi:MAG: hypothetical protein KDC92_04975 [Bacteroidetes bacterium]|nr:hypothetical protein [Bacteroidota bacterium]